MGEQYQHVNDTEARLVKKTLANETPWPTVQKITGRSADTTQPIVKRKLVAVKPGWAKLTDSDIAKLYGVSSSSSSRSSGGRGGNDSGGGAIGTTARDYKH